MDDTATYIFVDIIEKFRPVIFAGYCVIGSVHSKVAQIMGTNHGNWLYCISCSMYAYIGKIKNIFKYKGVCE